MFSHIFNFLSLHRPQRQGQSETQCVWDPYRILKKWNFFSYKMQKKFNFKVLRIQNLTFLVNLWKLRYFLSQVPQSFKEKHRDFRNNCQKLAEAYKKYNLCFNFALYRGFLELRPKKVILLFPEMRVTRIILSRAAANSFSFLLQFLLLFLVLILLLLLLLLVCCFLELKMYILIHI